VWGWAGCEFGIFSTPNPRPALHRTAPRKLKTPKNKKTPTPLSGDSNCPSRVTLSSSSLVMLVLDSLALMRTGLDRGGDLRKDQKKMKIKEETKPKSLKQ